LTPTFGAIQQAFCDDTYKKAAEFLEVVGLKESPQTLVKDIGVGKQQMVEIAKALAKEARLLGQADGIPFTLVWLTAVVLIYTYFTQNTVPGRYLYALGGNEKAGGVIINN